MRYEFRVIGTREELIREVTDAGMRFLSEGGDAGYERARDAARAVNLLEEGDNYVELRCSLYVVEEGSDVTDG